MCSETCLHVVSPTVQLWQPLVSGILYVTAHFLKRKQIKQHFLLNLSQTDVIFWDKRVNIKDERRRGLCVTWVKACAWAAPPSAGLSEPVRTTPSVNGSKGALIYLQKHRVTPTVCFSQSDSFICVPSKGRSCRVVNMIWTAPILFLWFRASVKPDSSMQSFNYVIRPLACSWLNVVMILQDDVLKT